MFRVSTGFRAIYNWREFDRGVPRWIAPARGNTMPRRIKFSPSSERNSRESEFFRFDRDYLESSATGNRVTGTTPRRNPITTRLSNAFPWELCIPRRRAYDDGSPILFSRRLSRRTLLGENEIYKENREIGRFSRFRGVSLAKVDSMPREIYTPFSPFFREQLVGTQFARIRTLYESKQKRKSEHRITD